MEEKNAQKKKRNCPLFLSKIPVLTIAGILIGAVGGFIYYKFVGCTTGSCAITSNPYMSTAWGGAFGYLIFDLFRGKKKNADKNTDINNV